MNHYKDVVRSIGIIWDNSVYDRRNLLLKLDNWDSTPSNQGRQELPGLNNSASNSFNISLDDVCYMVTFSYRLFVLLEHIYFLD